MKSDVKPVFLASNVTTQVLWTGPTRLRGFMIQSTGTSGACYINGLASETVVSSSTNTQVFFPIHVGAGATQTFTLPEDGVLYAERGGVGIVDGIGVTGNTSNLSVTLFIDK